MLVNKYTTGLVYKTFDFNNVLLNVDINIK